MLTKVERNYWVTRKELLAVLHFVKHFRHYLQGRKFRIRTDHAPLCTVLKVQEPEGQLARWIGSKHQNADVVDVNGVIKDWKTVNTWLVLRSKLMFHRWSLKGLSQS